MYFSVFKGAMTLVVAGFAALVLAGGSRGVTEARTGGGINACPAGWHQVTPSLNPVLLCLPNTIVLDGGADEAPPEAKCPEGWLPATPPLNPVLGCMPSTVVRLEPSAPSAPGHDGTCPDGFRAATNPLNPVLGCIPDTYFLPPTRDPAGAIPPGGCPLGWAQVTPPLNPLLVCLPDSYRVVGGDPGRGR
jgi:hypothetical protein